MTYTNYREFLSQQLKNRSSEDPHYSLRAMARQVKISAAMLSAILSGKRNLSVEKAYDVAKLLLFNKKQTDHFVALVLYAGVRSPLAKMELEKKIARYSSKRRIQSRKKSA